MRGLGDWGSRVQIWLAVHSVEKYLKAVLLMNGKRAKKYRHNITKLYAAVTPLAPNYSRRRSPSRKAGCRANIGITRAPKTS